MKISDPYLSSHNYDKETLRWSWSSVRLNTKIGTEIIQVECLFFRTQVVWDALQHFEKNSQHPQTFVCIKSSRIWTCSGIKIFGQLFVWVFRPRIELVSFCFSISLYLSFSISVFYLFTSDFCIPSFFPSLLFSSFDMVYFL